MPQNDTKSREKAIRGVKAIFDRYHALAKLHPSKDGVPQLFDYECMSQARILDAGSDGSVAFEFRIPDRYANLNQVMHGGAYGVLFDMFTTTALGPLARPGFWDFMGGVTRALNITYIRPVTVGTKAIFRSKVVAAGKTMALIRGQMTDETEQIIYATVEHHKVNTPSRPEHMAVRVAWDDEMESLPPKLPYPPKL